MQRALLSLIIMLEPNTDYSLSLQPVASALRYCPYFTLISITDVPRREAVQIFSDTFRDNQAIEEVCFSGVDATEGYVKFGENLRANRKNVLKHIDFSENSIRDKGVMGLAVGIEGMIHGLKSINLSYCGIREKGIAALMSSLTSNQAASITITELDISGNDIGPIGTVIY